MKAWTSKHSQNCTLCKPTGFYTTFKVIPFQKLIPRLSYVRQKKKILNIYRSLLLKDEIWYLNKWKCLSAGKQGNNRRDPHHVVLIMRGYTGVNRDSSSTGPPLEESYENIREYYVMYPGTCEWPSTETGCPVTLRSLPYWRYFKAIWTQSYTMCYRMALH